MPAHVDRDNRGPRQSGVWVSWGQKAHRQVVPDLPGEGPMRPAGEVLPEALRVGWGVASVSPAPGARQLVQQGKQLKVPVRP